MHVNCDWVRTFHGVLQRQIQILLVLSLALSFVIVINPFDSLLPLYIIINLISMIRWYTHKGVYLNFVTYTEADCSCLSLINSSLCCTSDFGVGLAERTEWLASAVAASFSSSRADLVNGSSGCV